jgi:ribose-phosphate pyrophosphokinase
MQIIKYPDNSSYAVVHPQEEFTFRLNSYTDLWHLNQTVDALNNLGITPSVTIPNLIDAQADRRFNSNESSGLKLVCKFLNSMKANFRVFHPHNSEVVESLLDNVEIIDNSNLINNILHKIFDNNPIRVRENHKENLILMSSDAGGFKPLMKLCDKLQWKGDVYGASKSRKYEDGKSKLIQQVDRNDFGGKDILIIDDICVNGGTFIGLAKMLKERNVGKLYLAVSHLTVENPNPQLFDLFDKVFTTNSKYDAYFPIPHYDHGGGSQAKNLEVIKLFKSED